MMTSSPQPQTLKPLPPPGVGTYCPPMLWDQPPHLDSSIAPKASVVFTLSAHGVDSHCKAAKPSHNVMYTDSSTWVISQSYCEKIPKKLLEIPSSLPMVISWTPPCMLFLWPSPSVLFEKRHSWRQFTSRTGMITPWLDYSLLRDWPITSYLRS